MESGLWYSIDIVKRIWNTDAEQIDFKKTYTQEDGNIKPSGLWYSDSPFIALSVA